MYLGRIVEEAETAEIFDHPLHPYTRALLAAVPVPDPKARRESHSIEVDGSRSDVIADAAGCPYRPRCPDATPECEAEEPVLRELRPGHRVACIHAG
jgi:peptide/nickel transport system ATP-binding protein